MGSRRTLKRRHLRQRRKARRWGPHRAPSTTAMHDVNRIAVAVLAPAVVEGMFKASALLEYLRRR